MSNAEAALLSHFLSDYSDRLSSDGCNDMEQSAFSGIDEPERLALKAAFDEWDRIANPEDWEPRRFAYISNSSWVCFLRSRVSGGLG